MEIKGIRGGALSPVCDSFCVLLLYAVDGVIFENIFSEYKNMKFSIDNKRKKKYYINEKRFSGVPLP